MQNAKVKGRDQVARLNLVVCPVMREARRKKEEEGSRPGHSTPGCYWVIWGGYLDRDPVFQVAWSRHPIWGVRFCVWIRIRVLFKKQNKTVFLLWPQDVTCPLPAQSQALDRKGLRDCGFPTLCFAHNLCWVLICSLSTFNQNFCIPETCKSDLFGEIFLFSCASVSHLYLYLTPATHS